MFHPLQTHIVFITVTDAANVSQHTPQQSPGAIPNRRKVLPSPEVASGDLGLWSILRKNIGECLLLSFSDHWVCTCYCRKRLV